MDLKKLATKPTLQKVTVETDFIVQAYGEPLEFYMYDRQTMPIYLKLSTLKNDQMAIFDVMKEVILDKDGNKVLGEEDVLPLEIMTDVLNAVVEKLGNTSPQTSAV